MVHKKFVELPNNEATVYNSVVLDLTKFFLSTTLPPLILPKHIHTHDILKPIFILFMDHVTSSL
jgi:hypothetical protein